MGGHGPKTPPGRGFSSGKEEYLKVGEVKQDPRPEGVSLCMEKIPPVLRTGDF